MIYIVSAVFNRKEITRRFLEALRNQTVREFRVFIIDDGSTDGTADMLANDFPEVSVISGTGSLWWTGSMRLGVEKVREIARDDDYVICANNDQIPKEDAIEVLLKTSRTYDGALVGSLSKSYDHPDQVYDAAFSWDWKTNGYTRVPIKDRGEISSGVDVLTCRFTIVPMGVFSRVSFDSDRFPHYLGDYDFFLEAKKAGYSLVLSYDSIIYDVGGPSGNYVTAEKLTLRQLYSNLFNIRSHGNVIYMTRYVWKHCPSTIYKGKYLIKLILKTSLRFTKACVHSIKLNS